MIDCRQCLIDSGDRLHDGGWRARYHQHLYAPTPRRCDFGIGRGAAAILRNHDVDAMCGKQTGLTFNVEGAAIEDEACIRQSDRQLDGIDATNKIEVLRGTLREVCLLSPDRQKHPPRDGAERRDRFGDIGNMCPSVTFLLRPLRATQGQYRNADPRGGLACVLRNPGSEGMRRVDQKVETTVTQKRRKSLRSAKATCPRWNRLGGRFFRAPSQRHQNVVSLSARQRLRHGARLGGAAEHQNADLAHV